MELDVGIFGSTAEYGLCGRRELGRNGFTNSFFWKTTWAYLERLKDNGLDKAIQPVGD